MGVMSVKCIDENHMINRGDSISKMASTAELKIDILLSHLGGLYHYGHHISHFSLMSELIISRL